MEGREKNSQTNRKMTEKLMFRLLPIQILLAGVSAVNGIVTGLFASNTIGDEAMSAVGLYTPINTFIGALSFILVGGAMIRCGQYIGRNETEKMQSVFSLDILLSVIISVFLILFHLIAGLFTDGSLLTADLSLWPMFRIYLLGQTLNILPDFLGSQLAAFLSLENQAKRTTAASLIFIIINTLLCFLFLKIFDMGVLGLALAASLGRWVFFLIEALYYLSGRSMLKVKLLHPNWKETLPIVKTGAPGGISYVYLSFRGIIVNSLLQTYTGSVGLSAFTAANGLLGLFWAIPTGMLAVSRLLISISIGEEDEQTLTDTMKTAMFRYVPLMCAIDLLIILSAPLLAGLYFHSSAQAYELTAVCFRILPLCMPLSIIFMHFNCYHQNADRQITVHILSFLDGIVSVAAFSYLLVPTMGITGVCIANVLNGIVTILFIFCYAVKRNKHIPRTMAELMTIPEGFGIAPSEKLDMTVNSMEEVINISREVQKFCREKGLDEKRSYYASLFLEEMAGNVIEHGFTKDKKKHTVEIRVIHKKEEVLLRIKDDCIPFDPAERKDIVDPEDATKNIGIRMVYSMAEKIDHQNILGLNILTIHI